MIRGLGVYTAEGVVDISDVRSWTEPGDGPVDAKLAAMREAVAERPGSFAWVGLFEPTRSELEMVKACFDLPALQMEDAANPHQRPKFEAIGQSLFALVKVLDYLDRTSDVRTGQIAVFVGKDYVITIRFGNIGDLRPIRERLAADGILREDGPVSVLYAVLDQIVDDYLVVADEIALDIEDVESGVFNYSASVPNAATLYRLKRENVEIRRAVAPLVPWAHDLTGGSTGWLPERLRPYFRDIGEHVLRAADSVESSDNLLMSLMMVSTAVQDLQQNRDMRKISAWIAIAAVPTMIAGIYGMNFDTMPELQQPWGYPVILGVMATACILLYRAFKRSGWL